MKPKKRGQGKRNRRNIQRPPSTAAVSSVAPASVPSQATEPPLAWSYLLAGGAVMLLSFAAVVGGFADGSIVPLVNLFQGDTWYFQELYQGLVNGYPANGHRAGVAPTYFPETLAWFALAMLLPADAAWFGCGLVLNLFGAAGWVMVCRRLGGGALSQSAVLLAYAAQYLLLAYGNSELFLLLVLTPFHNGAWQAVPWLLWAYLGARTGALGASVILLFVLLTLVAASDMLIVPWFVAPAALIIALQWRRGFIQQRAAAVLIATMVTAVVAGRIAHNVFGPFEEALNTGQFLTVRPEEWVTGSVHFFRYMAEIAGLMPHLALLWVVFIALWLRVAWRVFRKSDDAAAVFVVLFIPASAIAACGAMVAAGLVIDPDTPWLSNRWYYVFGLRYIYPAVLFPLLVGWAVLVAFLWERRKPPVHRYLPAALAVCALAAVPKVWAIDYQNKVSPFNTPFASCMRGTAKRMGWSGGIGTWSFFRNSIVDADNPIERALPVENMGVYGERFAERPLMVTWDSTNRHYFSGEFQVVAIDQYKGRRYLGTPRTAADQCQTEICFRSTPTRALNEEVVRAVFGEPAQILECEGVGLYHYDPPIRLDFSQHTRSDQFPVFLPGAVQMQPPHSLNRVEE